MSIMDEAPTSGPNSGEALGDERLSALEREVERYRVSRDGWTLLIFALAALALIGAAIAIGVAATRDGGSGSAAAASGGGGGGGAGEAIAAELTEFKISLTPASVSKAGIVTVHNGGSMVHNLYVTGTDLKGADLAAGASETLDLSSLAPGTYELYCNIAGHKESGMKANLVIGAAAESGGATATTAPAAAGEGGMTADEAAAMDKAMIASAKAFPAKTAGVGNQILEPTILADGTKHFELTAAITDWEVTPGKVVKAWTYNGMVPGPRINVAVGDKVEVVLTNNLPVGTEIHWHGINTPNDQDGVAGITQDMVMPGQTYTYRFTTVEPAIGMYHAHAHGELAVVNGLFGAFYVGDVPNPLGKTVAGIAIPSDLKITQDIPMVLNDAGVIGLSLNGKGFPATEPVIVKSGDWFRVTYFNEGLLVHPMHMHGFPQIVVAKDGMPLDAPYAADTILVAPGERYTVLVHPDRLGTWVWHCHILNHAESANGLIGMVTALIVQ